MFIEKLRVQNFRNLCQQELSLSPGVNLFVGQNGQGKTNLLEAVVFLGSTKSFRTARSRDAIAWGADQFSLSGIIVDRAGPVDLGLMVSTRTKEVSIHGKRIDSPADYLGKLMTITFSPQDLDIVRGGPSERRALLDRHMIDLSSSLITSLVTYGRALKVKMALIKRGERSYRIIEPWNQILAREMLLIAGRRKRFVEEIAPRAAACYERFTSSSVEVLTCEYRSPVGDFSTVEELLEGLERDFAQELATGNVRMGIHRDDLKLSLSSKSAREFASQGQARSIVLSLKLAILEILEAHRHESPIVLLDDVDAELDKHRANSFFQMMLDEGRQVIVTSTDAYGGVLRSEGVATAFEVTAGLARPL